jgi:hypothetical protein
MLSQGTPMMLMGDEYGHTKGGNNNTYGLDGMRCAGCLGVYDGADSPLRRPAK